MGDTNQCFIHPEEIENRAVRRAFVRRRPAFTRVLAGEDPDPRSHIKEFRIAQMNRQTADGGFRERDADVGPILTAIRCLPDIGAPVATERHINDVVVLRINDNPGAIAPARQWFLTGFTDQLPAGRVVGSIGGFVDLAIHVPYPDGCGITRRDGDGTDERADRSFDRAPGRPFGICVLSLRIVRSSEGSAPREDTVGVVRVEGKGRNE
jgi:hypothetical protein